MKRATPEPGASDDTTPLDPEDLERTIRSSGSSIQRARFNLITSLATYDSSGFWVEHNVPTCAHWAAATLDVTVGTAREWLRIGHVLDRQPLVRAAYESGNLTYGKVRTLTRITIDHPGRESDLVELAASVTASELGRALAMWTGKNEDPDVRNARHKRNTYASFRTDPDGMGTITLRLPPLEFASVCAAVTAVVMARPVTDDAEEATVSDDDASVDASATSEKQTDEVRPSLGLRRAKALVSLTTGENAGGTSSSPGTEVILHVRGDGCTLNNGTPVAGSLVERLVDSAFLRVMIHDAESRPINASGRHRHPTTRQKRVVDERHDHACVDCGGREFLEHDHKPPFEETKRTIIDELEPRCHRCHTRRHGSGPRPRSE